MASIKIKSHSLFSRILVITLSVVIHLDFCAGGGSLTTYPCPDDVPDVLGIPCCGNASTGKTDHPPCQFDDQDLDRIVFTLQLFVNHDGYPYGQSQFAYPRITPPLTSLKRVKVLFTLEAVSKWLNAMCKGYHTRVDVHLPVNVKDYVTRSQDVQVTYYSRGIVNDLANFFECSFEEYSKHVTPILRCTRPESSACDEELPCSAFRMTNPNITRCGRDYANIVWAGDQSPTFDINKTFIEQSHCTADCYSEQSTTPSETLDTTETVTPVDPNPGTSGTSGTKGQQGDNEEGGDDTVVIAVCVAVCLFKHVIG